MIATKTCLIDFIDSFLQSSEEGQFLDMKATPFKDPSR